LIFLPGAPNPAQGRLVLVEPQRCLPTDIPVAAALKALLSTGKIGLDRVTEGVIASSHRRDAETRRKTD
jgi:uncharacterized membrane protein